MGQGPARTLNADGPLNDFQPRTGIHHPLDKAEVAAGQGLARPQPDYEVLHGQFGRLVKFDQLLQLVALGHRMFGPNILGPEQLICRAPFLGSVELCGIRDVVRQICECSSRAPNSGK